MQPPQRDRLRALHGCRARCRRLRHGTARAPLPRRADGRVRCRQGRPGAAGPRPPRLRVEGAARPGGGGPEGRPAAGRGRHVQSGAGHRHGRGRSGHPGGVAAVGRLRAPARRPRRASGRRGLDGRRLPQVPRRSGAGGGGHRADALGRHRGAAGAGQSAGRPRPAARRHGSDGHLGRRGAAGRRPAGRPVRRASRVGVHGRAGHARRPLPLRRLRRVAPAPGVGPRRPDRHGPPRRPAAGRHLRRHDPRPRPVRCVPGGRRLRQGRGATGGRARRGDGLRVARRRCLHARYDVLAHRGHHPRPGAGHPRPRGAGPAALLEGRPAGPPPRTGPCPGRVPARTRRARPGGRPDPAVRSRAGRLGGVQRAELSRRAETGLRPCPRRPHDRRGAVPRRARRLAGGHPLPLRRAGPRPVGAGPRRPARRALRHGRPGDACRRRHRAAAARRRPDGPRPPGRRRRLRPGRRPGPRCTRRGVRPRAVPRGRGRRRLRPRRGRPARHGPGRRLRAVRLPVPRMRRPCPAAAAAQPRKAHPAVAAAPARRPAPPGGERVRVLPDRAGGRPRMPPGRLRRTGPDGAHGGHRGPPGPPRGGHHPRGVAVRPVAPLRLCRPVPVRGRLPARRAPRRRPVPGLPAAGRAAGPGRAARAAGRRGAGRAGA